MTNEEKSKELPIDTGENILYKGAVGLIINEYEKTKRELALALSVIKKLKEGNDFYADYSQWAGTGYHGDEFDRIIKDMSKCKDRDNDYIGGRKARQIQKETKADIERLLGE